MLRFNHLLKPFDKAEIRRAVITAVDQEKFLQAGVGNPDLYRVCASHFPCGSPLENDAGLAMIRPGVVERAEQMLAHAGDDDAKVVRMQPTRIPPTPALRLCAAAP